jgi:hypothetical protein
VNLNAQTHQQHVVLFCLLVCFDLFDYLDCDNDDGDGVNPNIYTYVHLCGDHQNK